MPGNRLNAYPGDLANAGGARSASAGSAWPQKLGSFLAKQLRILLTGSAFFLFWAGGAVISWIILPAMGWHYRRDAALRARRCREFICRAFRWHIDYMRGCRLISFDPRSLQAQLPREPFVLVANHPTLIDVVLLLASYPSICCVAKGPLFRSPLVGRLLRLCNHIDAGDGSVLAGAGVVLAAMNRLQMGDPILIFPEGTRSPSTRLGRFKSGAFSIACRAGVPLVPILIEVWPPGLMKGMPWYKVPESTMWFEMAVLPAVDCQGGRDPRELAASVQALLQRLIDRPAGSGGGREMPVSEYATLPLKGSG